MSDGPLADRMRGHLGRVGNASTDHVPAPSGHAPRTETWVNRGFEGLIVREAGTDIDDGRWIQVENPADVRQ
jgi:hypothetical protein